MSLTPKQNQFLKNLLESSSVTEAIEKTGMSSSTAYKYMNENEEFKEEYRKRKNEILTHISTRLNQLGEKALSTLESVMNDEEASPASRVSSARTIIEFMYKAKEIEDLELKLEELESILKSMEGENKW